ncbi:MAG: beta-ketoacyl-ACP synthase II [Terriglobia bacterium]
MERRVAVTGVGVVSPVGTGIEEFWKALIQAESGLGPITHFDSTGFGSQIAGEVSTFDAADYLDDKQIKRMDRYTQFALGATKMAVQDGQLLLDELDRSRVGVIIGSGIGGLSTLEAQHKVLLSKGPRRVSPFLIPMMIADMAAGQVSIAYGLTGPNWASVSACASGAHALGEAFETIRRGAADVVIAGGAEAPITPLAVSAFSTARALSTRNEEPEKASRPFDRDRDGFVIAEGAGILILESHDHAESRGARVRAELAGYGATADAHHMTAPDPTGQGAAKAMKIALDQGAVSPSDVGYVNAHGTSTPLGDEFETMAIKEVFGDRAYDLSVSSTKSLTGHLLGAAGGIEAIATILALERGVLPPTENLDNPDEACDLDYVPHRSVERSISTGISNSFAFGGHNVSLVFRGPPNGQ